LSYYNEDWIWLFLHKPKASFVKRGEVGQSPFEPFENAIEKALNQEFGEILVDGVQEAYDEGDLSLLVEEWFWNDTLKERTYELKRILHLCKKKKIKDIAAHVCLILLKYNATLRPNDFAKVFKKYFDKKADWLFILNGIDDDIQKIEQHRGIENV
jgi:hypothetical protein